MFHKFVRRITTVFLFIQAALIATETKAIECEEHASSQIETFVVSPQDLHLDRDNILMNLNGHLYVVHSLRKNGH